MLHRARYTANYYYYCCYYYYYYVLTYLLTLTRSNCTRLLSGPTSTSSASMPAAAPVLMCEVACGACAVRVPCACGVRAV